MPRSSWATIQRTLHRAGAELVLGRPKTERSRRQVALLPALVSALRIRRKIQLEERLGHASIGITLDPNSRVLPDMHGEIVVGLQKPLFATA